MTIVQRISGPNFTKDGKTAPDAIDALALELFMAGGIDTPFKPEDQPLPGEAGIYPHARCKYTARKIREFCSRHITPTETEGR